MVVWWLPPKQRQRWGDTQILPSGTWGNIFFDLFYVGGAYNLGNMIKNSNYNAMESVLYFCGAGFPIMIMWFDKMYYDARFTTRPGHDVAHRIVEVIQICAVATALSRLRSPQIMSNSTEHSEMFQFTLSLFLISFITILKYIEVIWHGVGDPAAKVAARRDIKWRIVPTLCFFTATLESGMHYFLRTTNPNDDDNDDDHTSSSIHRPIWYCLAGWVSWIVFGFLEQVVLAPQQQCHEISVPMNVHFCMHRYGEWFMLMFGESIISLLIVDSDNESISYTVAFYSGILSVIFLAHLHFRSEPKHVDDHALSRSRVSNFVYTVMVPIYSAALIAIGVSYKMFLYEFMYKENDDNDDNDNGGEYHQRELGGGGEDSSSSSYGDTRKQFAANVFSASMTIAFVCIDFMLLTHKGIHYFRNRFQHMSWTKLVTLSLSKVCLMVLLASLSSFQYDLHVMAFCGLGAILVNEFLRNSFMAKGTTRTTRRTTTDSSHEQQQQQHGGGEWEKTMDDNMTCCTAVGSYSSSSDDSHISSSSCSSLDETVSVLAKFEQEQEQTPPPPPSEYNHHYNNNDDDPFLSSTTTTGGGSGSRSTRTLIPEDEILPDIDYSRMAEI